MEMHFKDCQRKEEYSGYSATEMAVCPDVRKRQGPHDSQVCREQDGLEHLQGRLGPKAQFAGSVVEYSITN